MINFAADNKAQFVLQVLRLLPQGAARPIFYDIFQNS